MILINNTRFVRLQCWIFFVILLFTAGAIQLQAQTYETDANAYLELQPQFIEYGDNLSIYFNLKFEDREAPPVNSSGDNIYDHLEELNIQWNGRTIYLIGHTGLNNYDLGSDYQYSEFTSTRFANDSYYELIWEQAQPAMNFVLNNTTAYDGNQDVVQLEVSIDRSHFASLLSYDLSGTSNFRVYGKYYDRGESGNSHDAAGTHFSKSYTLIGSEEDDTAADEVDIVSAEHNNAGLVDLYLTLEKRENESLYDHADELILYHRAEYQNWEPVLLIQHTSLGTDIPSWMSDMAVLQDYTFQGPDGDTYRYRVFNEELYLPAPDNYANYSTSADVNFRVNHYYQEEEFGINHYYSLEGDFYVRDLNSNSQSLEVGNNNRATINAGLRNDGSSFDKPNLSLNSVTFDQTNQEVNLSWDEPPVFSDADNQSKEFIRIYRNSTLIDRVAAHSTSSYTDASVSLAADYEYFIVMEYERFRAGSIFSNESSTITVSTIDVENGSSADEIDILNEYHDARGFVSLDLTIEKREGELFYDHADELVLYQSIANVGWKPILLLQHTSLGTDLPDVLQGQTAIEDHTFTGPADTYRVRSFVETIDFTNISELSNASTSEDLMMRIRHFYKSQDMGSTFNYSWEGDMYIRDGQQAYSQFTGNQIRAEVDASQVDGQPFEFPEINLQSVQLSDTDCQIELSWLPPAHVSTVEHEDSEYMAIYRDGQLIDRVGAHTASSYTDDVSSLAAGENYSYHLEMQVDRAFGGSLKSIASPAQSVELPKLEAPVGVLTEQANCDGGITVDWIWQGASSPDAFIIQRQQSEGTFETIEPNLDGSFRDYTDNNVVEGTQYTYRIAARGGVCNTIGYFSPGRTHSRDTLDISNTIVRDALSTSKGYFGDRTELFWEMTGQNEEYINRFRIYARELGTEVSPVLLESPGRDDRSWIHDRGDAGTIYEYFVVTERVVETECGFETTSSFPIESVVGLGNLHQNLPDSGVAYAVGFRSPTAVINGSITYSGGVAVSDVKVVVEPTNQTPGKSLYFNGNTRVTVEPSPYINVDTALTLSAWVKPSRLNPNVMLYKDGSYGLEYNGTEAFMFVRDTLDQTAHVVRVPAEDYKVGNWVNLTCTYSSASGALNLYVNGEKTGETVFVPEGRRIINQTNEPFLIGDYHSSGYEFQGFMDEIRIYNRALSPLEVQREYGRITSTNSKGLVAYWKVQEGAGKYIYDAAHLGSYFYKHDGAFSNGVLWSDDVPSRTQLGIAAYTESNGSYSIEGIPYAGNGQNFQVVPTITLAGIVHEFDPQIKTLYLGEGNNVENGVDFEDISVFNLSGKVVYDFEDEIGSGTKSVGSPGVQIYLDGVTPLVDADDNPITTDLSGEFEVSVPIGYHYLVFEKDDHTISSGGRWPPSGFFNFVQDISGVTLYDETTHQFVGSVSGGTKHSGLSLFSGDQVNNIGQTYFEITSQDQVIKRTVETDSTTGVFDIDLPPLQYTISSIKWSVDDLVVVPSSDIAPVNLRSESAYEGSFEVDSTESPVLSQIYPELAARQAISNFAVISMDATTIDYSWTLERNDLVSLTHQWISDTDTIDYFIDSEPSGYTAGAYSHQVDYAGASAIAGESVLPNALLLVYESGAGELFEVGVEINHVSSQPLAKYDTLGYEYIPDSTFYSVRRDFSYRVAPTLEVTTLGDTIFGGEKLYSYNSGTEIIAIDLTQLPYPTFFSNEFYELEITAAEVYTNKDNLREYQIPVTDGTISINSSIGIPYTINADGEREFGSGSQLSLDEDGRAVYLFTGGNPNTSQVTSTGEEQNSFTTTINASLETSEYNVTWPQNPVTDPQRAYVMGRVKIPGASFVTEAPEIVEMILRDPPGSDSYAFREAGTSYTMTEEFVGSGFGSLGQSGGGGVGLGFAIGGSFVAHGELSGDAAGTIALGMKTELEASAGSTVERSVEYVETISTNAEPIEVGASDLFVAKSQNLETGLALKVLPLPVEVCGGNCFGEIITLEDGSQYQMGLIQESYVSSDGLPTYVLYTENHITTVLIPDLEDLRNSLLLNNTSYTSNISSDHPYFGSNNDDPIWEAQATSANAIKTEAEDLSGPSYTFNNGGDGTLEDSIRYYNQQIRLWKDVLALNEIEKWAAMQSAGLENISLASGVTLERSVTNTASAVSTLSFELSRAITFDLDIDINAVVALRADLNAEVGMKANSTSSRGEESANTTGYVLLDSDENDLYSINVAPGVGSSGPIFSTVGGQTSCPYEPAREMKYATPEYIDRAIAEKMKAIEELQKSKNLTDIIVAQVEEQIQKAQDDIKKIEKDITDYGKTIEGLVKKAADAEGIQQDVQTLLLGVVEGVPGLLQTAVEPVVAGVNEFIGSVKDFSIPIPFAGDVSPFESIPEIPLPENPTGDLSVDMSVVQELVERRMRDVADVAKGAIDSGNELIVRLQKRLKERLFDINKLTERKLELELDIDRINAEIDALNEQITLFGQLQQTLENSSDPIFLSNATLQREKPTMQINGAKTAQVYNVPADESANFTLLLNNESESGHSQYYAVEVLDQSNPNGLVLKIDGETLNEPREYWVNGNSSINKVMTVERGPFEYDYNDVQVVIHSTCQYDPNSNTALIVDTVSFDVKFIPTCSDVVMLSPQENWVGNSTSSGTLPIHIGEYDINSTGLEYIQIEYKASSSSEWLQVVRYYRDENVNGYLSGDFTLPQTGNEFVYDWDFGSLGIPDGNYDLRVVAQCQLAKTESEIHSGLIDTVLPHVFGTPQPADGIYSAGDEISIQFNEPINEGLIQPSDFKMTGVLNGADIRHYASVYFNGTSDHYMEIAQGINLTRKSFSVDLYVKRDATGAAVLFAQGGASDRSLVVGFDTNDRAYLSINNHVLTSDITITDNNWHHLAVVYDHTNHDALIYIDGQERGVDNSYLQDYQSSGRIFIGKSTFGNELPFMGNIHELRIWNKAISVQEVNIAATKRMTASERGLIGNWRMEEAQGDQAKDLLRSKHAQIHGQWTIEPGGLAYTFDGVSHLEASSPSFGIESDFTVEFWVNGGAVSDSVTFLSNGRGDAEDSNTTGWAIGTDASGQFIVKNSDQVLQTGTNILDNSWHHVAIAVNRIGNAVCYLDGDEAATLSASNLSGFGGSKLWIGARGWYEGTVEETDQHFSGSLDEIRIWSLAKRADHLSNEIQNKLNGDETGLIIYYPFESYQDIGGGVLTVNQDIENQAVGVIAVANDLTGSNTTQFTENTPAIKLPRPVENVSFNYSSNGDQIILSPTVEAGKIENVTLSISLKDIYDLNGNKLASPITWTAYVDRSTLNWVDAEKNFDVPLGEGVSFTAEIYNQGGNVETFSLTNLPTWLTANPSAGSVKPLTSEIIEFTVSDGTNIGSYVQDIVMENSFGFDERLILNLNVFQNPPEDWTVNPEDYEYSMSVLSRVRIKGEFSRDESDLVGAFINGECRGVGSLQYISSQDNYQAYLSVYSNDLTGESIDYRIWNASEGLVHTFVTNSNSGVETFTADGFYGTVLNPVIFDAGVNIERVQEIKSGWQWLSFNLTSDDFSTVDGFMKEFPSKTGDQIKSQQYYDQYDSINGWVGTISTVAGGIQSGEMYKFRLANAGKLKYRGEPVDPANNAVTLNAGWNWISFLGQNLIPIDEALANVTGLSTGDVIKSQRQFATFAGPGVGWIGSLSVMEPGQGYMYKAVSDGNIVYPQAAATARVQAPDFQYFDQIGLSAEKYPENMTMIAETNFEYDYLLAYAGEELRGIAIPVFNPMTNTEAYFMTVFGANDAALRFTGIVDGWEDELKGERTISFKKEKNIGTLSQPVQLKGTILNTPIASEMNIYPNPVKSKVAVSFESGKYQKVALVSMAGQEIASWKLDVFDANITLDLSEMASGVYVLKLEGEETISRKLIKE